MDSDSPESPPSRSQHDSGAEVDDVDKTTWKTKDTIHLIQLVVSDRILNRFQTTKKSHVHLWNDIAKEFNRLEVSAETYTAVQIRCKFNNMKRQYMKRLKSIERSGADPSNLHDWVYYTHLEPYFRTNKQVSPDNEESSEVNPQTLKFPRKRKASDARQEDAREKRFRLLLVEMKENKDIMAEHLALKNELLRIQLQQARGGIPMQAAPTPYYQPYYTAGYSTTYPARDPTPSTSSASGDDSLFI